ncbi:MAG: hypothetical protein V2B19_03700 [Pseudomonadota bacterium]
MIRLNIRIKDHQKAELMLRFLRELPFVEIEGNTAVGKTPSAERNVEDLFGIWENRPISLHDLRKSAWGDQKQ